MIGASWGKGGGRGRDRISEPCLSHLAVYQQPQQQPVAQSYGGYKEPAAPVSIPCRAPGGGGVSSCGQVGEVLEPRGGMGVRSLGKPKVDGPREGLRGHSS